MPLTATTGGSKIIYCKDYVNELNKHSSPTEWKGSWLTTKCTVPDISHNRWIIYSTLEGLMSMDYQYRNCMDEVQPNCYDILDIHIAEIYNRDAFYPVLRYKPYAVTDLKTKNYYCANFEYDQSFRPLWKEYELFIISQLPNNKEFYYTSFLMAVQRTVYLWLMSVIKMFELKGTVPMMIIWGSSKKEKELYQIFQAVVIMEFDMTEVIRDTENNTQRNNYDIRLTLPLQVEKFEIEKCKFGDDTEFYDYIWEARRRNIHEVIDLRLNGLKCVGEDISDIV